MTMRRHPITGAPVLFVPERAARPGAFGQEAASRCPFCPGHESDTPPTLVASGDPWRVRAFPNKYPATEGAEVIVESPRHGERFDDIAHAEDVVAMYVDRYRAHRDATYTAIFKNEGVRAGASIPHVHSQVMPVQFTPPRIASEGAAFGGGCPLCAMEEHLIRETESFRWLSPAGSWMAYQNWIVPKRHVAELSQLHERESAELASLLKAASAAMLRIGNSYNWNFVNFPRHERAHFYVDLHPRLTSIAGFELGTGTFVEIINPADAARRLM
jgi:UDPglucose--hexose-1-phosphate uridylyltransferase